MYETYTDLLIHIRVADPNTMIYPVEASINYDHDGHFVGETAPFDEETQVKLSTLSSDFTKYGEEIFYALFNGSIRRAYDKARAKAEADTGGRLRIRLWIDNWAAELHAYTWEYLSDTLRETPVFMATTANMPFSRYFGLEKAVPPPVTERPIHMLFAISNPQDLARFGLAELDVVQEIESLRTALNTLRSNAQLQITLLPGRTGIPSDTQNLRAKLENEGYQIQDGPTTLDSIIRLLNQETPYHILHFLGHGSYRRRRQQGTGAAILVLEDEMGNAQLVRDEALVTRLSAVNALPRLVFLSACESAKRSAHDENPFVGLAPKLIKAGVPSVVAMQDLVPITTARELTSDFYRFLLEHGIVDKAMNQARLSLFESESADWAIPVLFMRLREGQLFAADAIRAALRALANAEVFNPLPSESDYLPLEVLHLANNIQDLDVQTLDKERIPSRDCLETVEEIFSASRADPPRTHAGPTRLVALSGGAGMGKSIQIRRIGKQVAQQSLDTATQHLVLPVYIDLQQKMEFSGGRATFEGLIFKFLQHFWEDLTPQTLHQHLQADSGLTFRLLVDGSDALPANARRKAWNTLNKFISTYPHHEYLITYNATYSDIKQLSFTDLLILEPLTEQKIKQYLMAKPVDPVKRKLYVALEKATLFDLAGAPWALIKMFQQAKQGMYATSRAQVLEGLVEDTIAVIASDPSMRTRAAQTLYELAWRMQSTFQNHLSIEDLFNVMDQVRRKRTYDLEDFQHDLMQHELLESVGGESIRFTRPPLQAYCCARAILTHPERDQILDNITATLGRRTRLQWWKYTLLLLSGLMKKPETLIRKILYGVTLSEGEQLLFAARCIQECGKQKIDDKLLNYVAHALLYRLDSSREPRISRRVSIIEALSQLEHPAAIPRLVEISNQKIRQDGQKYEYSSVRLAAVKTLQHITSPPYKDVAALDAQLAIVLNYWHQGAIEALVPYLLTGRPQYEGLQAIAAFALGTLQTKRAIDIIAKAFLSPNFTSEAYWNVSTALTLLDPGTVTRRVILPLLSTKAREEQGVAPKTWEQREKWYEYLIYLIGRIRTLNETARAFLYTCLNDPYDVGYKALAIQSLGWLYDRDCKHIFENIVLTEYFSTPSCPYTKTLFERFDHARLAEAEYTTRIPTWSSFSESQRAYLQGKSLQALYYVGDEETLDRLQDRPADWGPELEHDYYWMSENILSRLGEM